MKSIKQSQEDWYKENAPLGKQLGYPKCCILEFCRDSPEYLKVKKPTKKDELRYKAGCIDNKFTGFIPCWFHAKEILLKKISIHELITDRDRIFKKFPLEFQH